MGEVVEFAAAGFFGDAGDLGEVGEADGVEGGDACAVFVEGGGVELVGMVLAGEAEAEDQTPEDGVLAVDVGVPGEAGHVLGDEPMGDEPGGPERSADLIVELGVGHTIALKLSFYAGSCGWWSQNGMR